MLKKIFPVFLFCFAASFLFFFLIPQIPLWSSDEGRFAEIARAMYVSGNWLLPYFNGLPYMEKPAFSNWMTAASYCVFGVNAFAARFPGIASALGCLAATYVFTKRFLGAQTAYLATVCLLTSLGFVLVGRFAVIDMEMIFFLSLTIFFVMAAIFDKKPSYYLLASIFMGITFLIKGLIGGALPALILFSFLIWNKKLNEIKKINWLGGILIFSAITIPWLIAVTSFEPEFLDVFLFQNQFQRFTSGVFGRRRPFYFFAYVLPIVSFPWIIFLPAAIAEAWKSAKEKKALLMFFVFWAGTIFIFFSIPNSKLPYYIVPMTLPIAILCGNWLAQWINRGTIASKKWSEWSWKIACFALLLGAIGINISFLFSKIVPELALIKHWGRIGTAILGAGAFALFYCLKKDARKAAVYVLAGTIYAAMIITFVCMLRLSPMMSSVEFAEILKKESTPEDIIAIYSSPDHFSDFPFYLQRRVLVVGSDRGTLTQESLEPDEEDAKGWFLSLENFLKNIHENKTKRIFCLLEKERLPHLKALGFETYRVWLESHDRILISNF